LSPATNEAGADGDADFTKLIPALFDADTIADDGADDTAE
jgi:hypothetical protein